MYNVSKLITIFSCKWFRMNKTSVSSNISEFISSNGNLCSVNSFKKSVDNAQNFHFQQNKNYNPISATHSVASFSQPDGSLSVSKMDEYLASNFLR
jgi:hypothetical protein